MQEAQRHTHPDFNALVQRRDDPSVGLEDDFFDRFYFNMHGDALEPLVLIGGGYFPNRGVVDGYVIAVANGRQHNLRFSDSPGDAHNGTTGPLSWSTEGSRWRLRVEPNPSGVELDVNWTPRAPAWEVEKIVLENGRGGSSDFRHYFQSGRYSGTLRIHDDEYAVEGWYGQRDRSRGRRAVGGGQGFHIWVQAQFPETNIAFLFDADRAGNGRYCSGAVLREDGSADPIVDVKHNLDFEDTELRQGHLEIQTASGAVLNVKGDLPVNGGGYLAGGGYGGWHGQPRGNNHLEHEIWTLDGSVTSRDLPTPITDRLASFRWGGESGVGVFEFSRSRHPEAIYRPTLVMTTR